MLGEKAPVHGTNLSISQKVQGWMAAVGQIHVRRLRSLQYSLSHAAEAFDLHSTRRALRFLKWRVLMRCPAGLVTW